MSGCGYDEKFASTGSMTLAGVDAALKAAGVKFDFIGFDTRSGAWTRGDIQCIRQFASLEDGVPVIRLSEEQRGLVHALELLCDCYGYDGMYQDSYLLGEPLTVSDQRLTISGMPLEGAHGPLTGLPACTAAATGPR